MSSKSKNNVDYCSFCGAPAFDGNKLIAGNSAYICKRCVDACNTVFQAESPIHTPSPQLEKLPTPLELKDHLDQYVVGQEKAKKVLSVAVYNHYKRIFMKDKVNEEVELEKSNVLLLGPTGTGKTLLAKSLAKKLNVPFAIADATTVTEAGYVGDDVENILLRLIQNAKNDIALAQSGIIYIDEIDKIARKSENRSITRDVSGEGVQQALLKIIEGTVSEVPPNGGRKHPMQENLKIDTSNILFICGGAFAGLENIINERNKKNFVGFTAISSKDKATADDPFDDICNNDLVKYGLIPELIGRLPITVALSDLKLDDLKRIISEPKNSILKQYKELFKLDNVELNFANEAIETIAQLSIERKTGARGIRSIIETLMNNLMFEIPNATEKRQVTITKENVLGNENPKIITIKKTA